MELYELTSYTIGEDEGGFTAHVPNFVAVNHSDFIYDGVADLDA